MSKKTVSSTPASALSPIPETIPSQLSPAPSVNGAVPSDPPIESFFAPPPSTIGGDFNFAEFRAPATPTFVAVDEGISPVRVKKPDKTTTFYVHETWREYAYLLPGTQKYEAHLVLPDVAAHFPDLCRRVLLVPYCDSDGNFGIWAINQEDQTGEIHPFSQSAMQQVKRSIGKWCQILANKGNNSYRLFFANDQRKPPNWPSKGFPFLLQKAFEDRIIKTVDHPLLRQLRGREAS